METPSKLSAYPVPLYLIIGSGSALMRRRSANIATASTTRRRVGLNQRRLMTGRVMCSGYRFRSISCLAEIPSQHEGGNTGWDATAGAE
jgi:hypothetical protein